MLFLSAASPSPRDGKGHESAGPSSLATALKAHEPGKPPWEALSADGGAVVHVTGRTRPLCPHWGAPQGTNSPKVKATALWHRGPVPRLPPQVSGFSPQEGRALGTPPGCINRNCEASSAHRTFWMPEPHDILGRPPLERDTRSPHGFHSGGGGQEARAQAGRTWSLGEPCAPAPPR